MSADYRFVLTGISPLLMHADDVMKADELDEWRKATENKNRSKAGDDRSPAWTWQTYCYPDGDALAMPQENVMVCLRQAGAQIILKKQKTFKELTQSGMVMEREFCEFLCNGKQVPTSLLESLRDEPFTEHVKAVRKAGFDLFVKRARVGQSKHVRVRPKFTNWSVRGLIHVLADEISEEILRKIFELSGRVGLCDWRPGCKTPGPYGMYRAEIQRA
jgi:hypothetical protein